MSNQGTIRLNGGTSSQLTNNAANYTSSGTVELYTSAGSAFGAGNLASFCNLLIDSSSAQTLGGAATITGNLTISGAGSLSTSASKFALTVGGTLNANGGTVNLNSGGTVIFSVSGHVTKPGNLELPMGIPFKDLMELCGGVWKGRKLKAVIPGGSSCMVLPADVMWGVNMDYDSLKKAGSSFGTGAVIVMDETTCMVRALERLARFYMSESCGQCTPCREGTGWLDRMLKRIIGGQGRSEDLGLLLDVANRIEGHTICALGDAAAWPVQSFLIHFRHEFQYMIEHKGRSIVEGQPAPGAAAVAA